jgi:hypothetical protein
VAPFAVLARLHDKDTFQKLVERLGLPTPQTVVARNDAELREAIDRFPRYFARAAFSRGGVSLLTNTGPLAGHLSRPRGRSGSRRRSRVPASTPAEARDIC